MQSQSISRWDWYCLALPMLGISPLLYLQATFLWSRQHLQFFPLALLAAAWFIRTEGVPFLALSGMRARMAILLSILGFVCCYCAIFLYSSWMAHVALIVLVFAWCLGKFSNLSVLRILGICGLLSVSLPPPNNGDQLVVQSLQSLSTKVSSQLMDITRILHVQSGNVIDIESKSLFVEEACSGVDSQYALMAVAGTLLLVGRAGLFVSLITIVTVPLWAILGNLFRIYFIVIGIEYFGIDLSAGVLHTFLGLATFSLAAWAHWSSVQFLNYVFWRVPCSDDTSTVRTVNEDAPISSLKSATTYQLPFRSAGSMDGISISGWSLAVPCLLMVLSPLLWIGVVASEYSHVGLPKLRPNVVSILPSKTDFPISQLNARRVSFSTQERNREDLMGQHSRIWSFADSGATQIASLDLPFRSWHPLWWCYEGTGWTVLGHTLKSVDDNGKELEWPYFEVRLENAIGEFAFLHFSHFLKNGEPFVYLQSEAQARFADRNNRWILPTVLKQLRQIQEPDPVTFQFQFLSITSEPATKEQIAKFRSLFFEAREEIRKKSIPAFRKLMGE